MGQRGGQSEFSGRGGLESPSMYEPQDRRRDSEDGRDGGSQMMDRAGEQATAVKDQAAEQMDRGRERVAEGAHDAAERLREEAEHRGGMQGKVGTKAADSMEQAASYLRDHKTDEIWADVERYARDHPVQAVGGAVVAGFLLGRILR